MQFSDERRTAFQIAGKRLRLTLSALWRRPAKGPSVDAWGTAVDRIVEDLEDLNRSTERDFLAVGEKLMDFRTTSRRIASDMNSLTELISGGHARDASQALAGILDLSAHLNNQIEQSCQALGQIRDLSSHVRLVFAGLRNTVSIFRTLCTLTRIETSRLGSTGAEFGDLAAEARPLSESIQTCGEHVLEASSRLDQSIQSAIRKGSELRARQFQELPALVADVTQCLKAFDERRQRALEASAQQAVRYEELSAAVEDVVSSVQFHDITRQQVEHVVLALRNLRCERGSGYESRRSPPHDVRAILALQSSQLAGAAGLFASSVERTERDLESMAARVQDVPEACRSLMGISADEQDSFFLMMEGHFTAILEMLSACAATQVEMETTIPGVEDTIRAMAESVAEIRGIEIRIQRIAINAVIRAVHLGSAGNGLNVIAEIMGKLALESNRNTEDAAATIEVMRDSASRVSGGSAHSLSTGRSATGNTIAEMRRTILDLHSSGESTFSHVSQIADSGAQLVSDIGALRSGFSAGPLFAGVVSRARGELGRIAAQAVPEYRQTVEAAATGQLESLAKHYTMQAERDVHASVANGTEIAAPAAGHSSGALEDGDLGDNVELF